MSALRNDMHQRDGVRAGASLTTGLGTALASAVVALPTARSKAPVQPPSLNQASIVWKVRAGSLAASLKQQLRGVHDDHDVELVWTVRDGSLLRCCLRAGQSVLELASADATVQQCEATGLWHVQTRGGDGLTLVATLRAREGGWEALYARSNALDACGLAGGRYEVERD